MEQEQRKDADRRAPVAPPRSFPHDVGLASISRAIFGRPWRDLVGVDLAARSIHVARVVRSRGAMARIEAAERLVPPGAREGDRQAGLDSAVREAAARVDPRGKSAAATIRGNEIVVRRISLPAMKRADLIQALTLECRKHVQYPIEDAEIRYEIVRRPDQAPTAELDLLVAVAPRRMVRAARETLERAGLRPVSVTIRPVALRSLLKITGRAARDEVVAYLDVGATESHIMVFRGEEIRFTREFAIGVSSLTDALRSIVVPGHGTLELTLEAAERLRRDHGIPIGAEEAAFAGAIPLSAVSVMLRPILERFVRELWNSFDYCNEQYQGEAVGRAVLLGEGTGIRNLAQYLTGVLKIPVENADLFDRRVKRPSVRDVSGEAASSPMSWELASGLSMLSRGSINFLEPAGAGVPYRVAEAIPQRAAAAAAAVLLLSMALPAEVGVLRERQRVGALRARVAEFAPSSGPLQRFRAARDEEARSRDLAARLSGGQVVWSDVLRDLSHRIGPDARLLSLEVLEPKSPAGAVPAGGGAAPVSGVRTVRISGLLRTPGLRPERVLGELMESLGRSAALGQVWLEGCRSVAPGLSSFTLGATLTE
jgi:type IV pilus assembly protein PilM